MKSSKISKGRTASKKVGNHCSNGLGLGEAGQGGLSLPLMMSLTKNLQPPPKFYSLATIRLAESFEPLNSSLPLLAAKLCSRKVMCDPVVLAQKYSKRTRCERVNNSVDFVILLSVCHKKFYRHMLIYQNADGIHGQWKVGNPLFRDCNWYLELDQRISMPIYIGQYGDVADVSYQQNSAHIYWEYLFIEAATLLFCTERSEIQVATSNWSMQYFCPVP